MFIKEKLIKNNLYSGIILMSFSIITTRLINNKMNFFKGRDLKRC